MAARFPKSWDHPVDDAPIEPVSEEAELRPVADGVEDAVLRTENWLRNRSSLVAAVSAVVVVVCLGWWLFTPSQSAAPIEDLIPQVGQQPIATDVESARGEEATANVGLGDGGPSNPLGPPSHNDPANSSAANGVDSVANELTRDPLVVHVVGEVRRPGLVSVQEGSRIGDVVDAAGGATDRAAIDLLNLAEPVVDGMQVRVPTRGDEHPGSPSTTTPLVRRPTTQPSVVADQSQLPDIDINRAGWSELQALPGIGPSLATAIVAWRDEHGSFASVDDLERVPGIGSAKLAALRDVAVI